MKQIIKNFNNLVKKTIFNVQNKTNNNFKISDFNKYLITFIALLFIYIFYLLLPILYDKSWLQSNIENKLLNEFKLNLSTSGDISYRILPAPHFLVKDSKILINKGKKIKSIAEIIDFKVFLSQKNFFNKEKMNIKKVVINGANFSILKNELKLLNNLTDKKFSNKKIKINNSNIFIKDNLGEIISIIKVDKTIFFFDSKKLLNILNLNGEIFNLPFNLDFKNSNDLNEYKEIIFKSKPLKLRVLNKSNSKKIKLITGENIISFLNSQVNTKYKVREKLITFKSDNSRINNSQINYEGKMSINPFDLYLNVHLDNYKISKLFNINPILNEFVKSGLLFNENLTISSSIIIDSKEKKEIFQKAKINFNIVNGKLNFDNTIFVNNIGLLKLDNSNLFLENNNLILNTNILFEIKNSNNLFSILNTDKKSRKDIKNILINLDYDFLKKEIKFNKIKIDNKNVNDQFFNVIEGLNAINSNNTVKSKLLINKLFSIYEG